jgi:hypothetical protein
MNFRFSISGFGFNAGAVVRLPASGVGNQKSKTQNQK